MKNNKERVNDLSYQELVTLKGFFNPDLYNAIFDGNYTQVDYIMLTNYKSDIEMHNIINIGMLDLTQIKADILAEQLTGMEWAL